MSATASLTEDLRLIASTSASRWPAVSSPSCSTSAWKSLASTMVLLAANQLQGTSHYFMSEQSHSHGPTGCATARAQRDGPRCLPGSLRHQKNCERPARQSTAKLKACSSRGD